MNTTLAEVAAQADHEAVDTMIRFLNGLLELDSDAIARLIEVRVPCNKALAEHPTVQTLAEKKIYSVGLLGILNGYIGIDADGWGFICAVFDDSNKLTKFIRTPPRKKAR